MEGGLGWWEGLESCMGWEWRCVTRVNRLKMGWWRGDGGLSDLGFVFHLRLGRWGRERKKGEERARGGV